MLPRSKRTLRGVGCTSSPTWLSSKLQPPASITAETTKHESITVSNLNYSSLHGSTYLGKGGDNSPHRIQRDTELCGHLGAFFCHNRSFTFPTADLGRQNQAQGPVRSHSPVPQPAPQPTTRARPLARRLGHVSPQPPGPRFTPQQPPVAQDTRGDRSWAARRGCAASARKNAKTRPPAPLRSAPGAARPSVPAPRRSLLGPARTDLPRLPQRSARHGRQPHLPGGSDRLQ